MKKLICEWRQRGGWNKEVHLTRRLAEELGTSDQGITAEEVRERLRTYGPNEVAHEKAPKWYIQFLEAFLNPFIGVLIVLAIISSITDVVIQAPADRDYTTVIVISIMVKFFISIQISLYCVLITMN